MTPVIHCSVGNITLVPRIAFGPRKEVHLTRCGTSEKDARLKSSQRFLLSHSSLRLFQLHGNGFCSGIRTVAAVGTDLTVEEQNPTVSGEVADGSAAEAPPSSDESSGPAPANPTTTSSSKTKRPRPWKSEMPPVKDEELVPGASFTGKVRSIQPFGCFVDFGAFTNGLVHISRMSNSYVKDVASVVSIGQEVKVRVVEANKETGRISLTMRDNDDTTKIQRKKESTFEGNEKPGSFRNNQELPLTQEQSDLMEGDILYGIVKNVTRSGSFVSLPDGEEGFLPIDEESEGFGGVIGTSSLQVGEEVEVQILPIYNGRITLTMNINEVDYEFEDEDEDEDEDVVARSNFTLSRGVVHKATNPFELAFRNNKEIAAFLNERERAESSPEMIEETIGKVETLIDSSDSTTEAVDEKSVVEDLHEESPSIGAISNNLESKHEESVSTLSQTDDLFVQADEKSSEILNHSSPDSVLDEVPVNVDIEDSTDAVEEGNITSESLVSEGGRSSANNLSSSLIVDESSLTYESKEATSNIKASEEIEGAMTSKSSIEAEARGTDVTAETLVEDEQSFETLSLTYEGKESTSDIKDSEDIGGALTLESSAEAEASITDEMKGIVVTAETLEQDEQSSETPSLEEKGLVDSARLEDSSRQLDNKNEAGLLNDQTLSTESIASRVNPAELHDANVEASGSINVQTGSSDEGSTTKATISPALVKQLREETGAGMMDCKKALAETSGDIIRAQEFLRKKGLASAEKRANRATAEGRIGSYIHDSRIGILIEVNCETDFVSRGEIFKELVDDLAMQVAACPQVRYLATEDVPEEIVNKEREIEMQKEDLLTKPENIRSKIVDGRIKKRLEEFALLEQPYIKNDKMIIKDLVKQTIATLGENINVKRFVRYNLGEGLEKKSQDFAAEVAAQTAPKPSAAVPNDQPTQTDASVEQPKTIAVSAALVKQLREETGAGMMDCKKALAESGGDLDKAQEYLRKKGLSSADKKSSRLAAEGRISSYIHDSRIGVLIEVNCETDFVGRNEKFKELVDDLAMQVVACPQVQFVSIEDIPEDIVLKEKEIEMQRDDLKSKPDQIKEKIVEGRVTKRLGELALLEQPFIKDDSIKVKDLVKQTIAALGENIKVRRFVRYTLGES